ncbi:MAG: hypothetical protein J6S27_02815 [Thermoguttaceae bacterium]|nr:hypothetical protein [Thermoguttaceae bacterium]
MFRRFLLRFKTVLWTVLLFFAAAAPLRADEVIKEEKEPIWVISWAAFFAFLAVTILLVGGSSKRRDSLLNEEQEKEYERALVKKRSELYIEDPRENEEE